MLLNAKAKAEKINSIEVPYLDIAFCMQIGNDGVSRALRSIELLFTAFLRNNIADCAP
jgi:hypothetical protein